MDVALDGSDQTLKALSRLEQPSRGSPQSVACLGVHGGGVQGGRSRHLETGRPLGIMPFQAFALFQRIMEKRPCGSKTGCGQPLNCAKF